MTRPVDTSAIGARTGRSFEDWVAFLDSRDAQRLPHRDIERLVRAEGGVDGWWAQTITVAYEQHVGRREPGERTGGGFQLSATRTLTGSADDLLVRWTAHMAGRSALDEVPISGPAAISVTERWRYWRVGLVDGSRVAVSIFDKGAGKSALSVSHEGLPDPDSVDTWRRFWRAELSLL